MTTPFWTLYFTVLSFVGGLCIGSFLNVCIYRIPLGLSIVRPRSYCPSCQKPIAAFDNIPVLSYLLLRGRCRACRAPISLRYPLVELLTGVLFLAIWNHYGATPLTPVYMLVTFGLILGSFVDIDHMILPDRVTLGGILLGLILSPLLPALHGKSTPLDGLLASALGVLAGAGSLYLVGVIGKAALKRDAMGLGDVKLLGAIGAFFGWQAVLFTIIISSVIGSVGGLLLIAFGGLELRGRMPFGPYLALAAVIWMLGGDVLWDWYISFITARPTPHS
ncbi:MAG TPA: prepilin peptidase [Kiritimatiellia bacterium]|nr:prepilin peptidase [Kiritimatiellia bacterium]